MPTIIVSGFGPWGRVDENPTSLVLGRLAALRIPGLVTLPVPVDTAALPGLVDRALSQHRPDGWIGLGLAMGSAVVAVERVAVNLCDFTEPDIAGAQPAGRPVVADGPAAYLTHWPTADLVRRLRAASIPARVSSTAGTFLCNQLMYAVCHGGAVRRLPTQVGFLHVPPHPALVARWPDATADTPSMDVGLMVGAVRLVLDMLGGTGARPAEA